MKRIGFEDAIRQLAATAVAHGEKLVVMRNYKRLPYANVGGDVDLLISRKRIRKWNEIVVEAGRSLGLTVQKGSSYHYCRQSVLHGLVSGSLRLDLVPHLVWRGVLWLPMDRVLERTSYFRDGIWIPHPADECVITFCHSYLYGGHVKEHHLPALSAQLVAHEDEVIYRLRRIFGGRTSMRIADAIKRRDRQYLLGKATKYRVTALMQGCLRRPVRFVCAALVDYLMERKITEAQARVSAEAKLTRVVDGS